MERSRQAAVAMAVGCLCFGAPALAAGPEPFALKPTSVELPTSDRAFPPGPGVEAVTNNCLACHSAGMVLNQPSLSKATWESEVHKMIGIYKAPVADADVATIVNYLTATKGIK